MSEALAPGRYPVHQFDPLIFEIADGIGPRYYGLAYVLGFAIGFWLIYRAARTGRTTLAKAEVEPFSIALVLGVIVGGRVGSMLLYSLDDFLAQPWIVFMVWKGGMASHGAFLGVCAAVLIFAWRRQLSPLRLGDAVAMAAPPGIFLGRVANFINGELWGTPTTVSWAWVFPGAPYEAGAPGYYEPLVGAMVNPRHPSQLYEAALEGVLLGAWVLWRFWGRKGLLPRAGQLVAEFWMLYAVVRVAGEQFRARDPGLEEGILGLSRGSFYSLLTFAAGLALFLWVRRQPARVG